MQIINTIVSTYIDELYICKAKINKKDDICLLFVQFRRKFQDCLNVIFTAGGKTNQTSYKAVCQRVFVCVVTV